MKRPALASHRRLLAQNLPLGGVRSCIARSAWQSEGQAGRISPLSVMVFENHYPSLSHTRFLRFGAKPGPFLNSLAGGGLLGRWAKAGRGLKYCFGFGRKTGKLVDIKKTTRGSQTCNSPDYVPPLRSRLCWPGASGTTFSAPVLARQRGLLSPKPPAATCLPARSSARARVRFAMMSGCRLVTDVTSAPWGRQKIHKPAGSAPGGFFYAKSRGGFACCASI